MRLPPEALDNCEPPHQDGVIRYTSDRGVDYSEYMWMAEEMEEFDRKCLEELLEDEFIEDCFEEMLAEEDEVYGFLEELAELAGDEAIDTDVIVEFLRSLPFSAELDLDLNHGMALLTAEFQEFRLNPNAPEFVPLGQASTASQLHRSRGDAYVTDPPPKENR